MHISVDQTGHILQQEDERCRRFIERLDLTRSRTQVASLLVNRGVVRMPGTKRTVIADRLARTVENPLDAKNWVAAARKVVAGHIPQEKAKVIEVEVHTTKTAKAEVPTFTWQPSRWSQTKDVETEDRVHVHVHWRRF